MYDAYYRSIWRSMHTSAKALDISPASSKAYKKFISSLIVLIPNKDYTESMELFMSEYNINNYTQNNSKLFEWTYHLHDYINLIRLNKNNRIDRPSLQQVEESYNNFSKSFWSKSFWTMIHCLASWYPVKTYRNSIQWLSYKNFILSLVYILPCPVCREHFKENIKNINSVDNYLHSRDSLFRFTYELHSLVNKQIGDVNISYEDAKKMYGIN